VRARVALRATALLTCAAVVTACPPPAPRPGEPLRDLTEEERGRFERGRDVFERAFTPETGLGPLFNAVSCAACHADSASGGSGAVSEVHASAFLEDGFCDPLADVGGPVFQQQVTPALRAAFGIDAEPVSDRATGTARRTTSDVFGFGLLDAVPDSAILALADPDDADGDGISGRVNRFFDGRLGRFGRKALVPTLAEFNEGAFQIEQGVTTPNVADEGTVGGTPIPEGVDPVAEPEIDAASVALVDAFVRFLAPPAPQQPGSEAQRGRTIFDETGCARCHVPSLRTGDHAVRALANREVAAYTDLLLHDMGPELADICLGLVATPAEFRTEPLMGLRLLGRFLHDGRATTIDEAIRLHGGEGARSRDAFDALPERDRAALLAFLASL
jgi:CxxC motif-containing protein (DUF1111 family)